MDMDLVGKKVFIRLKLGKVFQGRVLAETFSSLVIEDIYSKKIQLEKDSCEMIKEEF